MWNDSLETIFFQFQVLDLSSCSIESLNSDVFQNLPNLRALYLARNLLIEFGTDNIQPLSLLHTLNLSSNYFECKFPLQSWVVQLKNYTSNHGIRSYGICTEKMRTQKFQRMMMLTEEPPQRNGWIFDEEVEMDIEVDKNHTTIKCVNTTSSNRTTDIYLQHLMRVIELSPPLFVLFLFVFGFAVGKISSKYLIHIRLKKTITTK